MSRMNGSLMGSDIFLDIRSKIEENNLSLDHSLEYVKEYHGQEYLESMILEGNHNDIESYLFRTFESYLSVVLYFTETRKRVSPSHILKAYQKAHSLLNDKRYLNTFSSDFIEERVDYLKQELLFLQKYL